MINCRPLDHWTAASQALLVRVIKTLSAADRVSLQLAEEPDLASARAVKLTRQLVALNNSSSVLLTKLRLTPQAAHSRRELGFNSETGSVISDLIGGRRMAVPRSDA
jgi:hypothetical protein